MTSESSSLRFRLSSGAQLGYAIWGKPSDSWILYLHGVPGSRLSAGLAHASARRLGFSLLSVDRPGYGLSDRIPGHALTAWPGIVRELANHLGIDRFYIVGLSGGGPYALSCAASMPDKVIAAAVVSGMGPAVPEVLRHMPRLNRAFLFHARHLPWLLRLEAPAASLFLDRYPDFLIESMRRGAGSSDRGILSDPTVVGALRTDITEAVRHGPWGMVADAASFVSDWNPIVRSVSTRIDLWHGEADKIVPIESARHLAERLENRRTFFLEGEGHLFVARRMEAIVGRLLED